MPPPRNLPMLMFRFDPITPESLGPLPEPDEEAEIPWMLRSEKNKQTARVYLRDALLFGVSMDFELSSPKHRFDSTCDKAEAEFTSPYESGDFSVFKEYKKQGPIVSNQAVDDEGYTTMDGVKNEAAFRRNVVVFLAAVKNEAKIPAVQSAFTLPGSGNSTVEPILRYTANHSTRTFKELIVKLVQVLLAAVTSDHFRYLPLEYLRDVKWRYNHLWSVVLDRRVMCYLYDHAKHVLHLPVIFNMDDDIVIGHGAPANTKRSTMDMLKGNCLHGMEMLFEELNKIPFATLDCRERIPFNTTKLANLWKTKSKTGAWGEVMDLVHEDYVPTLLYVSNRHNYNDDPDTELDTDDEDMDEGNMLDFDD